LRSCFRHHAAAWLDLGALPERPAAVAWDVELDLVDVLQRFSLHPARQVEDLTPRRWRELFAANPLRSDLYGLGQ
jgi:hypothetical protein